MLMSEAAIDAPAEISTPEVRWPAWQRIGFRFACSYLALYNLPSPIADIPGGRYLGIPFNKFWRWISPWVAIHIFHLSGQRTTYFATGSGDTTLAYVRNLLDLVFALAVTLIWSALDRRRPNYRALHGWLRLMVRYTLAFALFGYGFAKVFPLQFQPARLFTLTEPFGQLSPMGVLWNFMGASIPYIIFSGAAELTGGMLLLFRRTTTLGALVSSAVLANVVALNFCYDVPVKLYSANLLLMAIFLAAPDARRLIDVLVLNRPAPSADPIEPVFARRALRIGVTVFWIAFVGYQLYGHISGSWTRYQQAYRHPPQAPIGGSYEVESYRVAGREAPPLTTNDSRWRWVDIQPQSIVVRASSDKLGGYRASFDAATSTLTLNRDTLHWTHPDSGHLMLEGALSGTPVSILLRHMELSSFPLNNRGFHWINEFPYNR